MCVIVIMDAKRCYYMRWQRITMTPVMNVKDAIRDKEITDICNSGRNRTGNEGDEPQYSS